VGKRHLLILTYEMDESSQLFSHQVVVVNQLAKLFEEVTVLTGKIGEHKVDLNVKVLSSRWQNGKRIRSIIRFLSIFLTTVLRNRPTAIFSHMTSIQSAFAAPITLILRIKHYLWYAHTSNNIYLKVSHLFLNGILTATDGSCPIKSTKVKVIGHSIDPLVFSRKDEVIYPIKKFIHIGRFDPIKNIELIVQTIGNVKKSHSDLTFDHFGSPSKQEYAEYENKVVKNCSTGRDSKYMTFNPSVNRSKIPNIIKSYDAFIHACDAGLDKSILEATLIGLPVVTINKQYLDIFGNWETSNDAGLVSLTSEASNLLTLSNKDLIVELDRRYKIALQYADIRLWAKKVKDIIDDKHCSY
jgi:glycosyltransferase involved in cell wall biosynthesis